jgi:hypothetical protein
MKEKTTKTAVKRKYRELSHEEILEMFDYNPDKGNLIYRKDFSRKKVNQIAGYKGFFKSGGKWYIMIHIRDISAPIPAHRLIWFWVHGEWPVCVDHLDRDGCNNRICNLRNVSRSENQKNQKLHKNNTSGCPGISITKRGKYIASISHNKKSISLGTFNTIDEAVKARKLAEIKYGYNENHGNILPIPPRIFPDEKLYTGITPPTPSIYNVTNASITLNFN